MPTRLNDTEIEEALALLPGWSRSADGKSIRKTYRFDDFAGAFALVSRIAARAEAMDHHPDIAFGWGRVDIVLTTHDAGGLSDKDAALAREIETAASEA